MKVATGIKIEAFDGCQEVADEVAATHLEVRLRQRADGENWFRNIEESQADLQGMQDYYVNPGGNFWIAREVSSAAIAGFVGLRHDGEGKGTLKRMAVVPDFRGHRLGQHLAGTLVDWAKEHDFERIGLSTGIDERACDLIYIPLGFTIIGFDSDHEDHLMELKLTS